MGRLVLVLYYMLSRSESSAIDIEAATTIVITTSIRSVAILSCCCFVVFGEIGDTLTKWHLC